MKSIAIRSLLACGILSLSAPVLAISDTAADCPAALISAETKGTLAQFLQSDSDEFPTEIFDAIDAALITCANDHELAADETDAVADYTLSVLIAEGTSSTLAKVNVPTSVINETMDVGPGRTNAQLNGFTEEDALKLSVALAVQGVDAEKLPQDTWVQIGMYLGAIVDQHTVLLPFRD